MHDGTMRALFLKVPGRLAHNLMCTASNGHVPFRSFIYFISACSVLISTASLFGAQTGPSGLTNAVPHLFCPRSQQVACLALPLLPGRRFTSFYTRGALPPSLLIHCWFCLPTWQQSCMVGAC